MPLACIHAIVTLLPIVYFRQQLPKPLFLELPFFAPGYRIWWIVHCGTNFLPKSMDVGIWMDETQNWVSSPFGKECNISAWFSDFASFHPRPDLMTSSLPWCHRRLSHALLVFWDNMKSESLRSPLLIMRSECMQIQMHTLWSYWGLIVIALLMRL